MTPDSKHGEAAEAVARALHSLDPHANGAWHEIADEWRERYLREAEAAIRAYEAFKVPGLTTEKLDVMQFGRVLHERPAAMLAATPPAPSSGGRDARAQAIEEAATKLVSACRGDKLHNHKERFDALEGLDKALRTTAPATAKPDETFVPCAMYEIGMDPATGEKL